MQKARTTPKRGLVAICASLYVLGAGSLTAAFLDHGTFSTDTNTGLDWLDVTQTTTLTYNAVLNGAGGWIKSGWRFATGTEVRNLFESYLNKTPEIFVYSDSLYAQSLVFVRQMGVGISFNSLEGFRHIMGPNYPTQIGFQAYFNDGTSKNLVGLGELIVRAPGI